MILIGWLIEFSVKTFQPIFVINRMGNWKYTFGHCLIPLYPCFSCFKMQILQVADDMSQMKIDTLTNEASEKVAGFYKNLQNSTGSHLNKLHKASLKMGKGRGNGL